MLGHLARRAECREVLSLTAVEEPQPAREFELVAAAAPSAAMTARRPNLKPATRAWLTWAAVAAGIVGVSGVACTRGTRLARGVSSRNRKRERPRLLPSYSSSAVQSPPAVQAPPPVSQPASAADYLKLPKATQERLSSSESKSLPRNQGRRKCKCPRPPARSTKSTGDATAASTSDNPIAVIYLTNQSARSTAEQIRRIALAPVPSLKASAFSNKVTDNSLAARPAAYDRPSTLAHQRSRPARARFRRRHWQPVCPEKNRKCACCRYPTERSGWAAKTSRVYRSRDEGTTWQPIMLPAKEGGAATRSSTLVSMPRALEQSRRPTATSGQLGRRW